MKKQDSIVYTQYDRWRKEIEEIEGDMSSIESLSLTEQQRLMILAMKIFVDIADSLTCILGEMGR